MQLGKRNGNIALVYKQYYNEVLPHIGRSKCHRQSSNVYLSQKVYLSFDLKLGEATKCLSSIYWISKLEHH